MSMIPIGTSQDLQLQVSSHDHDLEQENYPFYTKYQTPFYILVGNIKHSYMVIWAMGKLLDKSLVAQVNLVGSNLYGTCITLKYPRDEVNIG